MRCERCGLVHTGACCMAAADEWFNNKVAFGSSDVAVSQDENADESAAWGDVT